MDLETLEIKPACKAAAPEHLQICEDVTTAVVDDDDDGDGDDDHGTFQTKFVKKEEPDDQDHFFCEPCRTFFTTECNVHGPPVFVPDTPVPMGVTDRAIQTLPPGLEIRESSIPDAGFGVFNKGDIIPIGVHFGPYQGEPMDGVHSVVIWKQEQEVEYKDAKVEKHGNWMRYVNCARNNDEQNLVAFQYHGGILYRCCRPIHPGQELLMSYKRELAEDLSVTYDCLNNKKFTDNDLNDIRPPVISCSFCELSYTSQVELEKHVKRCHCQKYEILQMSKEIKHENLKPRRSSSRHCGEYTRMPANITNGQMQKKDHCCSDSGKSFTQKNHLQQPRRVHVKEKPYHCTQCGKNFTQSSSLYQHQRIHAGDKPYDCMQCGTKFMYKHSLRQHQRIHTGEKPYHCAQCGKNFAQKSSFRQHRRIHTGEKPYECVQCGLKFTYKYSLYQHQHVHTGEKPYQCTQCGKNFTQKSYLQKHQRIHTGKKPYQCMHCEKNFTQQSNLQQHQRIHTGERPFNCMQCGKNFTQKSSLQLHQRIHTGEKPYHCSQCGRNFTHQNSLQLHQRIHTGEKPYQCTQCKKTFNHQSNLQRHQRIHTGEKS